MRNVLLRIGVLAVYSVILRIATVHIHRFGKGGKKKRVPYLSFSVSVESDPKR
ncbi:unnamed protein product [Nyctereutes procyonoides]|uniref:(raccoon dog) hypothetical protein n=1 Tax=Nyctereutes procyonoides TaxID=34880 RepID=A0A811Z909_NYCPR|nr:unnamed protein product [Nyctereutes procyonoides]